MELEENNIDCENCKETLGKQTLIIMDLKHKLTELERRLKEVEYMAGFHRDRDYFSDSL